MKKKLVSLALALCVTLSLLPMPAAAAVGDVGNFADSNVTWIGTQSEFQQTLDGFFNNGMRKVKVAGKFGIMDATGAFIAPPIYDQIEPEYVVPRNSITGDPEITNSEARERLFVDGYTQCVRGGKYGLLNQYGEEVIPAQYDAVGLPSDGICRIVRVSGGTSYLGYWSLALGRELVAPNKYVVSGAAATAAGSVLSRQMVDTNWVMTGVGGSHDSDTGSATIDYEEVRLSDDRLAAKYDFVDGYAFVTTDANHGTILDKNGKEILPGGPYLFRGGVYPQFGPYMIYCKQSDKDYIYEGVNLGKFYNSGVVGPEGIMIPAQYNGGVRTPFTGPVVGDARMTIIPELKLVITAKDTKYGKENGGKVGVVNFQNQTVIPFTHDFNYFFYDAAHKVFAGMSDKGDRIYTSTGKRLNNKDYTGIGVYDDYAMINGHALVTTAVDIVNGEFQDSFVNLKTGTELPVGKHTLGGGSFTYFSAAGLVWLKNDQSKWGLVDDTGKIVLPYQFDAVNDGAWTRAQNGYAIVNIGHKQGIVSADGRQIVPCEYDKLFASQAHGPAHPEYVEATKNGKMGLISAVTGKLAIPCIYAGIGGTEEFMYRTTYFPLGVHVVKTAEGAALVDQSGNLVPGSSYKAIDAPRRGLFTVRNFDGVGDYSQIGPEGKVVIPYGISYKGNPELEKSETTLVVKDGKVGYINTGLLARPTQPKTLNPATAAANPSPTKLMVNGKAVAASAYLIGQNNYVKLRDLAYLVNGTGKNFEVTWDGAKNAINLKSGTPYTTVKGDMTPASGGAQTATRSDSAVYVDGLRRSLTAYTINGNNYFKLRDVMRVFDIAVGYDNATGTATLDTGKGYEPTAAEQEGITPAPGLVEQVKTKNTLKINKMPVTEYYMTKNHTFDATGMNVSYFDENGEMHDVPISELTFTADGKEISEGYEFQTSSIKNATVKYKGLTASFRIFVYQGVPEVELDPAPGETDQKLPDGKYTLTVLGNTVGMSNGWMVLDSKTPVVFSVKNEGDYYSLYMEGVTKNTYIGDSRQNGQLISGEKGKWMITHLGGSTYSIRKYDNPEMLVCTGAASKADGAKVMLWKHTDTPNHAIFTFTPAK